MQRISGYWSSSFTLSFLRAFILISIFFLLNAVTYLLFYKFLFILVLLFILMILCILIWNIVFLFNGQVLAFLSFFNCLIYFFFVVWLFIGIVSLLLNIFFLKWLGLFLLSFSLFFLMFSIRINWIWLIVLLLLILNMLLNFHLLLSLKLLFSFLSFNESITNLLCKGKINLIIFHKSCNCLSAVINLRKLDKKRNQIIKLSIFWIFVPRNDGNSLLGLKHISRWRIIQNHCIFCISSNFRHIFCKHSIYISAVLPKEPHRAECVCVHLVHKWICVLRQTCCEYYNFVILWHYL